MALIKTAEWSRMTAQQRLAAMRDISQRDALLAYFALEPKESDGPRLSSREWAALGAAGQRALRPHLRGWEREIVDIWSRTGVAAARAPSASDYESDQPHESSPDGAWTPEEFRRLAWLAFLVSPVGWLIGFIALFQRGKAAQGINLILLASIWPIGLLVLGI